MAVRQAIDAALEGVSLDEYAKKEDDRYPHQDASHAEVKWHVYPNLT